MSYFSKYFTVGRKKILLSLVTLFVTLLTGECSLQIYYRLSMNSWLWQYNAFHATYVEPVADRRQYALRPGFSDSQIGVNVNEKGFRAPVSMSEPDANTPVIAFIGDSKPFGAGVRDEQTYPFQLDSLLRNSSSPFRAVNAGIASYDTRQAIDRFRIDAVPNYQTKIVVLQGAFNDISLLTYYRESWNPELTWADVRYAGFTPPLPFFQKLATYYYLNRAVSQHSSVENRGQNVVYEKFPDEAMIANLRREIQLLIDECHQKSIPVVLIPVDPFYYQTANAEKNPSLPLWAQNAQYADLWRDLVSHYDELLIELSEKNQAVYFFDSRRMFDGEDRARMYIDYIHYSPAGNRRLAEGLFDFMTEKRLITQK